MPPRGHDLVGGLGFAAFLGIFYGIGPGLILGIPAYFVLQYVARPSIKAIVATGAVIASAGPIFLALSQGLELLVLVPLVSVPLGALGGLTFWFVALRGSDPGKTNPTCSPVTRS